MAGFKLKTRKAAAKRFRKATANGKILRSKGAHGHFLAKRGQKARLSQGTTYVSDSNFEQVNKLVPALGAKRKRSKAIANRLRKLAQAVVAAVAPAAAPKANPNAAQ